MAEGEAASGKQIGTVRRRTPTTLQMEAVECGAACLSMILGYFGRYVPLEILRYECGVSRDGTKASNIVKAARRYGLKAKGFSMEPADLRDMAMPAIIFWNFNHFVVLEGFGKGVVYLNDPATGPRTVLDGEFDGAFTGVTLVFEPGEAFEKGGHRPNVWTGLGKRMRATRSAFLFVVLASLGLVIPGLLVPAFARVFVDFYLVQGFHDWLQPLLLGMVATAILRTGLTWLQRHFLLRLQTKLTVAGATAFFWHVLRLPIGFFMQRYGGEVGGRVGLNERLADLIAGDLAVTVLNIVTMLVYGAIMVQYDVLLTVLAVIFAALNLVAFALVSRRLADGSQKLLLDEGKLGGVVMQGLQMMESFKASGTENLFFSRWAGHHAKVVNAEQNLARDRLLLGTSPVLLSMLGSAAILVIGGFRVMDGVISIGTLVAFQSLMSSFSAPVIGLVQLGSQLQEAQGDIVRLDDIMAHELEPDFVTPRVEPSPRSDVAAGLAKLSGHVELAEVTFGFIPTDPPLIEGLSLVLEPGSRVALVGGSGSGKSTVGKLIAGIYKPWSGEVRFDGIPMDQVPRRLLRNSLAIVDQDIALFEGSISDNISLWDPTMAEERIVLAARHASIHDEINERPDSYEFLVREGGRNFSGGQRQRMEIARALAINPSILLMDEATSALDAVAEKQVMDNVRLRGCSCIIIAHRLSTIRDCDEIILLERGRVVERGTHGQLLDAAGRYRKLIES